MAPDAVLEGEGGVDGVLDNHEEPAGLAAGQAVAAQRADHPAEPVRGDRGVAVDLKLALEGELLVEGPGFLEDLPGLGAAGDGGDHAVEQLVDHQHNEGRDRQRDHHLDECDAVAA